MASATTSCKRKTNKRRRKACRRKGKNAAERYWTDGEEKPKACRYCRSSSASVEMTAYMAATLVMLDKMGKAKPSIKWLGRQRNSQGGFVSTQDTVVALQALSLYSQSVARQEQNLNIEVERRRSARVNEKLFTAELTEENALLLRQERINSDLPVSLEVTGRALAVSSHRIIFPYLSDRLKRLRTFFIISPRVLKFCMKPPTPILDKTRI